MGLSAFMRNRRFPQSLSSLRTGMGGGGGGGGSPVPCGNNFGGWRSPVPYGAQGETGGSPLPLHPLGAQRQLGATRPGPSRPGLTGSSEFPFSDPPCPGLTGSLGLISPLQLWQKKRCCGTAAAASAIFPYCRRCRHSSQGRERSPERPRASGELVCSGRRRESAGERIERPRNAGSGWRAPW